MVAVIPRGQPSSGEHPRQRHGRVVAFEFPERPRLQPSVPYEGETERSFGFVTSQSGCRFEHTLKIIAFRQFFRFGRDVAGHSSDLLSVRQFVAQDDEELLELGRQSRFGGRITTTERVC